MMDEPTPILVDLADTVIVSVCINQGVCIKEVKQ